MSSPYIAQYYANGQWNYMYGVSSWSNTSERATIDDLKKEIARKKLKPGTDVMLTETATGNVVWSTTIPEPIVVQAESNKTASYTPRYSSTSSSSSNDDVSLGTGIFCLAIVIGFVWLGWKFLMSNERISYEVDTFSEAVELIAKHGYCTVDLDHEQCNDLFDNHNYIDHGMEIYAGNLFDGAYDIQVSNGTVHWLDVNNDKEYQLPIDSFLNP